MPISQLNTNDRLRATPATALRGNAAYAAPAAQVPARQPDEVSLSESARAMASAQKAVLSSPDVREDRVAAIKAALANGTYAIDSRQLARKLVQQNVI